MNTRITVVGGGIAGLTAAIACAEAGVPVQLHEAHHTLGGRGRATAAPYVAHEGAHVFYADGPHYIWLKQRGFVAGLGWPGPTAAGKLAFRADGRMRRTPPAGVLRAMASAWLPPPVDQDFRSWATSTFGPQAAEQIANMISAVTYDADTGRLSAAFVWELFQRVFGPRVPAVRWVRGGWQRVIDRMATRAVDLGVTVSTASRVDALPEDGPVIVATELSAARKLLGEDTLRGESGYAVLLDVAVSASRADRVLVFDLDEAGFHESYTMQDDSIAPKGESLYQLQMPVRAGESPKQAQQRLSRLADQAIPERADRTTFERTATAKGRTGALDLPGHTWRDRPAIARGNGIFLAGDMVAAPGMRGEIAINSGVFAAAAAVAAARGRSAQTRQSLT
ncbi:FAD-dependent oxidoreductase [Nocardia yunnanensis]|uniref:FAD-dependent oxidoreductase n=1 Tax=Nocardia yunnanensis TaxID=2382165 RepID=A0A386ZG34_9NOCA|nr:NAD(P)/FAD-dependent oxidoreductase [Nocardia yunnanensis]AYF76406.1 FAD-dependent oxidoreductase [Nocardia yunnanensis]